MNEPFDSDAARLASLSSAMAERYFDPLEVISLVVDAQELLEKMLQAAIIRSRDAGQSWSAIGTAVGCSRQNAFQRWRQLPK